MSLPINAKSKAIYGALQTVLGTAEVMTAANILRTSDLEHTIYDGSTSTIEYDGGTGRSDFEKHDDFYNKYNFHMDLIGGGDDGGTDIMDPPVAAFLRACGLDMDATVADERTFRLADRANIDVASLAVTRRVSTNGDGSFRVYRYDTFDARGQVGLSFNDDRPKFVFTDFTGTYVRPYAIASTPLGTDVTGTFVSPPPFINDSFTTLSWAGIDLCVHELDFPSLGWSVVPINKPGCAEVSLQEEKIVADITFKQTDFDTEINPFELAEDHLVQEYRPFALVYDDRPGHVFKMSFNARLKNPQETVLEDGSVGVAGQLEVEDGTFLMGWYRS